MKKPAIEDDDIQRARKEVLAMLKILAALKKVKDPEKRARLLLAMSVLYGVDL